jgi:hypothetical protein
MRRRLSFSWMVINQPPCDEDFDSASSRFEARIWPPLATIRQRCASCPFSLFPGFPAEQLRGRSHCS